MYTSRPRFVFVGYQENLACIAQIWAGYESLAIVLFLCNENLVQPRLENTYLIE